MCVTFSILYKPNMFLLKVPWIRSGRSAWFPFAAMSSEPQAAAAVDTHRTRLEEVERSYEDKPPFFLTYPEVKLLGIAGVSLFCLRCIQ